MHAMGLMRQELRCAQDYLDMITADITQAQLDWIPPGIANPVAAVLAHAVTDQDFICALLARKRPLYEGPRAEESGLSNP
jgi:hypothetical protein